MQILCRDRVLRHESSVFFGFTLTTTKLPTYLPNYLYYILFGIDEFLFSRILFSITHWVSLR